MMLQALDQLIAQYWDDRGFGIQGIRQFLGNPGKLEYRYIARLKDTYFRGYEE
jgi:hypothetical protein